ncbi:hypothetical protein [Roseivirga sp.]|uniref:hypothetical protein n=1 Tax=Roseivirga sp. TaxID=1964215 RepID=UPI003B51953A
MSMSKTEKLSHYAVVLIAVMAVIVSFWQVRIAQEHNRLSVRPYMDFFYGWTSATNLQLKLSNQGVGPAIITQVEHYYKGQRYNTWDDLLKASGLNEYRKSSYQYGGKSPFASGNEIVFLELELSENEKSLLNEIRTIVHYESIYQEPFELEIIF